MMNDTQEEKKTDLRANSPQSPHQVEGLDKHPFFVGGGFRKDQQTIYNAH
jgi:hypothetical protein